MLSPLAQAGNHPRMWMILLLQGGMAGRPVRLAQGFRQEASSDTAPIWEDSTLPKVMAHIPPLLQVKNVLGREQESIHPRSRGSKEMPSVWAGGTLAPTGQELVCVSQGCERALLGMPVWLSKSTALGANSLQLGFESLHPAGAD